MSMKPKIILTEEVTSQIMEYESKRDQLTMKRTEIEERFNMIQQVVQENAALELKAKKLIEEYQELANAESAKTKQYFPEIRLGILQKIVEFIGATPPSEPASGAAPAGGTVENPGESSSATGNTPAATIPPESKAEGNSVSDSMESNGSTDSSSSDGAGGSTPTA